MGDNVSVSQLTSAVPLVADLKLSIDVDEPNSIIERQQIPNVLAVGQNQQLPLLVRLTLEAADRLR